MKMPSGRRASSLSRLGLAHRLRQLAQIITAFNQDVESAELNLFVVLPGMNVLPIIREAQKAGARTLREIADALNARGIATARGGQWYAQSVANILERA
jgi:hypothetical protein